MSRINASQKLKLVCFAEFSKLRKRTLYSFYGCLDLKRAVVAKQVEIVEKCAARRQIFWDRTPLASCAQIYMIPFITSRTST